MLSHTKKVFCGLIFSFMFSALVAQPGRYAGTKKPMIGKFFEDSRNLTALKCWSFME